MPKSCPKGRLTISGGRWYSFPGSRIVRKLSAIAFVNSRKFASNIQSQASTLRVKTLSAAKWYAMFLSFWTPYHLFRSHVRLYVNLTWDCLYFGRQGWVKPSGSGIQLEFIVKGNWSPCPLNNGKTTHLSGSAMMCNNGVDFLALHPAYYDFVWGVDHSTQSLSFSSQWGLLFTPTVLCCFVFKMFQDNMYQKSLFLAIS